MKIDVLFFARIREQLGVSRLTAQVEQDITLEQLQLCLAEQHASHWSEVLGGENVVRAVNQVVAENDQVLAEGDEVAFYPPVTGG